MAPKELRIGNIVLYEGIPVKVASIEPYEVHPGINLHRKMSIGGTTSFYQPFEKIEGVPVTADLLIKCGFNLNKKGDGMNYFLIDKGYFTSFGRTSFCLYPINITDGSFEFMFWFQSNTGMEWMHILLRIDYLHELQNRIFALTGEELNVQL